MNTQALVNTVLRFSELGSHLGTLEINPLMVTVDGVAAADAVVSFVEA